MSCTVCRRDHRGFAFTDPCTPPFERLITHRACSMFCLDVIHHYWKVGDVIDPTRHESQALAVASDKAGEFLESINKTDLATMTPEEWATFIQTVYEASTGEIARLTDQEAVPF
jgi:hypothetical protein